MLSTLVSAVIPRLDASAIKQDFAAVPLDFLQSLSVDATARALPTIQACHELLTRTAQLPRLREIHENAMRKLLESGRFELVGKEAVEKNGEEQVKQVELAAGDDAIAKKQSTASIESVEIASKMDSESSSAISEMTLSHFKEDTATDGQQSLLADSPLSAFEEQPLSAIEEGAISQGKPSASSMSFAASRPQDAASSVSLASSWNVSLPQSASFSLSMPQTKITNESSKAASW